MAIPDSNTNVNPKRLELIKYANFLLNSSFVLFILGFIVLIMNPFKDLLFNTLGLSIIIIGCVFLAGYVYVRVKIIESDYQVIQN